jgi:hypothetical protein
MTASLRQFLISMGIAEYVLTRRWTMGPELTRDPWFYDKRCSSIALAISITRIPASYLC